MRRGGRRRWINGGGRSVAEEARRRRGSGGRGSTRGCPLATRGRGRAGGGVGAGGAAVEARFDGGLELAGVQVDGGSVLGSGDGKNGGGVQDRELRLYLGWATAAARWRPAGRSGAAWQSDGSTARGVEERRELWCDAWEGHVKLEVAGLALSGGASAASRVVREKARRQGGGGRK